MPISSSIQNTTFSFSNSTSVPLDANGEWTGNFEDVAQFSTLYTLWRTDVTGFIHYEFSMDGTTTDRSFPVTTYDLTDGNYISTGPRGRFFRIRYTNGPVAQTFLRIQTTYSATVTDAAHAPIAAGVSSRSTSDVTRAVNFGVTPTGTYLPIKVAADGTLIINTDAAASLSPNLQSNKLITSSTTQNQVVLSYTPTKSFSLYGWSTYVWDTMSSSAVVFGESSLESPAGTKLYTSQLSSMGQGKAAINLGQPLIFPANQTIRIVCSPSAPINSQTWQANLIGAS